MLFSFNYVKSYLNNFFSNNICTLHVILVYLNVIIYVYICVYV